MLLNRASLFFQPADPGSDTLCRAGFCRGAKKPKQVLQNGAWTIPAVTDPAHSGQSFCLTGFPTTVNKVNEHHSETRESASVRFGFNLHPPSCRVAVNVRPFSQDSNPYPPRIQYLPDTLHAALTKILKAGDSDRVGAGN